MYSVVSLCLIALANEAMGVVEKQVPQRTWLTRFTMLD